MTCLVTATDRAREIALAAAQAAADKLATDVVLLDVSERLVITSVDRDDLPDGGARQFVRVIEALRRNTPSTTIEILTPDFRNKAQAAVESIVEAVEERLRRDGVKPVRREGEREGRWVLLDFADVVVHVQHAEERSFYGLERLWKDCPVIPFVDRSLPVAGERAGG